MVLTGTTIKVAHIDNFTSFDRFNIDLFAEKNYTWDPDPDTRLLKGPHFHTRNSLSIKSECKKAPPNANRNFFSHT